MKTLFLHNKQIVYSIDFDIYSDEIEQLIRHVASTLFVEPQEIELQYEELEPNEIINKSNLCVTSDGDFIFHNCNNDFGVNFMEGKPIKGIRLSCDLKIDGVLERFLDRIIDNKADENLEFIV